MDFRETHKVLELSEYPDNFWGWAWISYS
jgi:hypothetical protein